MRVAILAEPRDLGCLESAWWVYFAGNPMQRSPASTTGIQPFSYNIRLLYKAAAVAATLRTAAGDLPVVIFSVSSSTQARTSCAFQQFYFRETLKQARAWKVRRIPSATETCCSFFGWTGWLVRRRSLPRSNCKSFVSFDRCGAKNSTEGFLRRSPGQRSARRGPSSRGRVHTIADVGFA